MEHLNPNHYQGFTEISDNRHRLQYEGKNVLEEFLHIMNIVTLNAWRQLVHQSHATNHNDMSRFN